MGRGQQQIRFCTSFDGTRIAHATAGTGPPIVSVGSWLTHLELDWESPIWSPWFDALTRDHALVRHDIRGSGLSDRSVNDLSLDALVRDLEAVVDDHSLDRFTLLGLCQGGSIAVAYAARHPERIANLILFGSYSHGALTSGASAEQQHKANALAEMIKVGWGGQNAAFRKVFSDLLMPGGSKEQQQWLADLEQASVSTAMAVRLWRTFHQIDVRDIAPRVQTPTIVFHAKGDGMIPFRSGCELASCIPNARFIPLDSDNHILLPDEPAWHRFVAEFEQFVSETSPPEVRRNGFGELTPREREVLSFVASGLSNGQIADQLSISPKTIRNHITRIFSKLDVSHRAEAIVMAREAGFGREAVR